MFYLVPLSPLVLILNFAKVGYSNLSFSFGEIIEMFEVENSKISIMAFPYHF